MLYTCCICLIVVYYYILFHMTRKLIIIIPCLNESATLPLVLSNIPRSIKGVSNIETIIIDDGSSDQTADIALKYGAIQVIKHLKTRGLAKSFSDGIQAALEHGADIIVNTDGDNQYPQADIGRLIEPILNNHADIVVANRQTDTIAHFSPLKKLLQKVGSAAVAKLSGIELPDAVSGFRAYSREAALQLNITTEYSYCTESIIQAGKKRLKIVSVPVTTNAKTRESRLFKNIFQHIRMSGSTMVRVFAMYEPLKTFFYLGSILLGFGLLLFMRFLIYLSVGDGSGHIQSLVIGAVLFLAGFQVMVLGLVSDLIAANRKLIEQVLYFQKQIFYRPILRKSFKKADIKSSQQFLRKHYIPHISNT